MYLGSNKSEAGVQRLSRTANASLDPCICIEAVVKEECHDTLENVRASQGRGGEGVRTPSGRLRKGDGDRLER